MDLNTIGTCGKILEEEWVARLRDGCCLYCGGMGHMAHNCPNKSRNPFCTAVAQIESDRHSDLNALIHLNMSTSTHVNPFGGGGGTTGGNGRNQGQSGNA